MRCFIVFNLSSKVVFFNADDDFKQSINKKQGQADVEKDAQGVNMNSVAQLFLPLFASQACVDVFLVLHIFLSKVCLCCRLVFRLLTTHLSHCLVKME
jgi:cadmium resistance protein CadD (predicted permease)